jgi:homoserine dehydrogenase
VSVKLRLAFVGFGNVGRRFADLLPGPFGRALRAQDIIPVVTGIATARHGIAIAASGLSATRAARLSRGGRSLSPLHRGGSVSSILEFIERVPADVLIETTPLDPRTGEPATGHVAAALRRGLHVVTANKGPVAFAHRRLSRLARRVDRVFLHEGAVMDGFPIFNLVERCLPGVKVLGFRGVLNATTTRILGRLEEGLSFEAALREVQQAGVAEADPSHDIEGWDAAVKACALANALMGANLRPRDVRRRGIVGIAPESVRAAAARGRRLRLVARGRRSGRGVVLSVAPEELPQQDVLASPADGALVIETDLMGDVGLIEGPGGVEQTAYALLSDLIAISGRKRGRGPRPRSTPSTASAPPR